MERRDECEKSKGMATARGIDPFLKTDLPTRTPKRHGQSPRRRALGFPPYDTGARSHMSYKLNRNTKEGEPPHTKHATTPRISALSSSPKPAVEKANRHARSMQPHHGCAPFQLRCSRRSSMEARAHMSCNRRTGYYVQRNRTATCANAASSRDYRTSATTRGSSAHNPTVPIKRDGHGSVSCRDRHDSWYDHRRTSSNCSNGWTEAVVQPPTRPWSHLQARILS
jgi:hypothetical protein